MGQIAVAALVGEVGAVDDLALAGQRRHRDHARVDDRDVDAAAGGARLVGADRLTHVGEGRAGRRGGGGRVLGLAVGPALHRAVEDDRGHAVRRAEGALGAGRHLCDESVDDGQRLPDRAAVALDGALRGGELVGLGAHDHRLQRAVRSPAREAEQRDRGQRGQQRDGEQQPTATIVVAIPTNSPHHVHETSSGSPRRRSFGAWSAYRSAAGRGLIPLDVRTSAPNGGFSAPGGASSGVAGLLILAQAGGEGAALGHHLGGEAVDVRRRT